MLRKLLIPLLAGSILISVNSSISASQTVSSKSKPIILAQSQRLQVTGTNLQKLSGAITSLAVSPDGQTLVAASGNGQISAIALNGAREIYTKALTSKPNAIAVSSDGQLIAVATGSEIVLYRLQDGSRIAILKGHADTVSSLDISPDSKTLVSVSSGDRTIRLWDLQARELRETIGKEVGPESTVAFSPDGLSFVTGSIAEDRTLKLWDAQTFQLLKTSPQQPGYIYDVAVSPDGRQLIAAVRNFVKVWEYESGTELFSLKGTRLDLNAIAISPDSRMVATANKEGTITLWDLVTGNLLTTLKGHQGWVLSVAFSPDGRYLYSGAEDKTIKVWQIVK